MNILITIISIVAIIFVGINFIFLTGFNKNKRMTEVIGFSFASGVSIVSLQMILYSYMNLHWSFISIIAPWVFLFIYNITKNNYTFNPIKWAYKPRGLINIILVLSITLTSFYVILQSSIRPLLAYDAWANWFLAGKAYYLAGNIDPNYILYSDNSNAPVLNLIITYVYVISGYINEQSAMIFFSFFFVFLIILFYFSARKFISQKYALLFTLLLSLTGNVVRHGGRFDIGYGDLPLGFFIFCSSVVILDLYKKITVQNIIFFDLFITTAALIKSEGLPVYIISQIIVFVLLFRKKIHFKKYLLITIISIAFIFSWYLFKQIYDLPENPFFRFEINLYRMPIVLLYSVIEYLNLIRWNLLWIMFFACLGMMTKSIYARLLSVIIIWQLFTYFVVYLTTPVDPIQHISNSYDRLLLHLTPIAFLFIAITLYDYLNKNKN